MSSDPDACVPKIVTDFVFDLYDSVTLSQIAEDQQRLYGSDLGELHDRYFDKQPWPSPQSIAGDCNGHPLFLAVYRELTHRQWHAVSRPTIRDRLEGWQVYRELFEEVLEADEPFFLLPEWCFDICNEFIYQFQGYCQVRSAVYASAKKHGLLHADGTLNPSAHTSGSGGPSVHLMENLSVLQNSADAWDVEIVYQYLSKLTAKGFAEGAAPTSTYLAIFSAIARSRLECLLGDYMGSLQALSPLIEHGSLKIPKDEGALVEQVWHGVYGARLSVAYHAGVSFLMLRRYRDAIGAMADLAAEMQRGFRSGLLRRVPGSEQFSKQYERMLGLLAILTQVCPSSSQLMEESLLRVIREKYGARMEASSSWEEFFMSPKFISTDPNHGVYRQQVQLFLKEMKNGARSRTLRSYLRLYTSLPVDKLASFHDQSPSDFLPLLCGYKMWMRQREREEGSDYAGGALKTALDIHYYVDGSTVFVDEAEKPRRFEHYFASGIAQNAEISKQAAAIDTAV